MAAAAVSHNALGDALGAVPGQLSVQFRNAAACRIANSAKVVALTPIVDITLLCHQISVVAGREEKLSTRLGFNELGHCFGGRLCI
jgi:hypothetical protein